MTHRVFALAIGFAVLGSVAVLGWWMLITSGKEPPRLEAPAADGAPAPAVERVRPIGELIPAAAVPQAATGPRVTGVVVAEDRPVSGASVTLLRQRSGWPEWRGDPIDPAITGPDGTFRFSAEQGPGLLIAVEHPQFASELVEASPALREQVLRLQRGFEVAGTVTNDAGLTMANVSVAIESTATDTRRVRTTRTSTNGSFRFGNVPGGTVRIVARHEWWQPAVLPAVAVGVERSVELRFDRPGLMLEGRVAAAATQEPVGGALVLALPPAQQNGRNDPAVATVNPDGTFRLTGLAPGNLRLEVRHPEHAVAWRTLVVGPAPVPLVIELPARVAVRGRLAAAGEGVALAGARLLLLSAANEFSQTAVAADGAFEFPEHVTPGSATLTVADGRFAFTRSGARSLRLRIEEGLADGPPLDVEPPGVVTGRVVDGTAAPIAGARLSVTQVELAAERLLQVGNALLERDLRKFSDQITRSGGMEPEALLAVTGADGLFRIAGLPPGPVALRIEHPGHGSRRLQVEVPPAGQTAGCDDVELPRACRISGRVLRGGRPLVGAVVGVVAEGLTIGAVTGIDGRYEIVDLPPGSYRVRARYSTLPAVSRETGRDVTPDEPATVDLEFPGGRVVRGTVVGSDGQPVEGAMVIVRGAGGIRAFTDASGGFVIEAPDRALELQVIYGERARHTAAVVAEDPVTITIDTPPTCTITGQVLALPGRTHVPGLLVRIAPSAADDESAILQSRWIELQGGQLRYPWFPAGRWRVTFCSEGHAPCVRDLDMKAGEEHPLGEIMLEPGCTLRGRVVGEDGRPVAEAQVFLGEELDLDIYEPSQRSGHDGGFAVAGVSTAASTLVVRAPGYAWKTVALQLPQDVLAKDPLLVQLERGSTIEVQFAVRPEVAGSIVLLRRQSRVLASAEVDEDGRAVFPNRGPGDYVVQRVGDDRVQESVRVTGSGQVVNVVLR
jgi:hypothetical protein